VIEKYYKGDCSEEEERSLREFFAANSPEGFETERELFIYYEAASDVPEPSENFESRILSGLDDLEARRINLRRLLLPAINIAAGMLILTGTYLFFAGKGKTADTFKDPAIAYVETMKILHTVSSQMNKGESALEPVGKINEITERSFRVITESSGKIEKNLKLIVEPFDNAGEQLGNQINKK